MQISRPHLHGGSAERESRCYTASIGNSACGYDRHFYRVNDLRYENERTELRCWFSRQKHSAMTTRLDALCNDCIDSVLLEPARFRHRRCGAEDYAAGRPEAIEK